MTEKTAKILLIAIPGAILALGIALIVALFTTGNLMRFVTLVVATYHIVGYVIGLAIVAFIIIVALLDKSWMKKRGEHD